MIRHSPPRHPVAVELVRLVVFVAAAGAVVLGVLPALVQSAAMR